MEYNIKLSKGKININGKEYDIPDEVAEFIIYETSTRDDIIQTRDVYKRTIDKAIEYINENKDKYYQDWGQDESCIDTYLSEDEIKQLLEILKEVE